MASWSAWISALSERSPTDWGVLPTCTWVFGVGDALGAEVEVGAGGGVEVEVEVEGGGAGAAVDWESADSMMESGILSMLGKVISPWGMLVARVARRRREVGLGRGDMVELLQVLLGVLNCG